MKLSINKNSLAILSVLAGVVYLFMLLPLINNAIKGGIQGAKHGYQTAHNKHGENPDNNFEFDTFVLRLQPKIQDSEYFPDSILNKSTNTFLPSRINELTVYYSFDQPKPLWIKIGNFFVIILGLPILVILILIPIEFYKLIITLYKNIVFTHANVRRVTRIGVYFLAVWIYMYLFTFMRELTIKQFIDLDKYEVMYSDFRLFYLLLALIILMIANVMKRAIVLKEEQELTI